MSLPRRQWFQPGDGIAREVISADIQRYLGPDATVRPGVGTGEYENVEGYWITAYKTLTSSQVQDLKQDSERWLSERRSGRESYNQSYTHQQRQAHGPSEPVRHAAEYATSAQPQYSYHSPEQSQYTYQQQSQAYPGYPPSQTYQQQPPRAAAPGYSYQPQAPADPRYAQPADPRYYPQSTSAPPSSAYPPPQPSSHSYYNQDGRKATTSQYPTQQSSQQYAYPQGYPQQSYQQYQQQPPPSNSSRRPGRG